MNTIAAARKKIPTPLIRFISQQEKQPLKQLMENIRLGRSVILKNSCHKIKKPCGIGKGLRTKVNVNIGASTERSGIKEELKKLEVAQQNGADTIMDLSVGPYTKQIRKAVLEHSQIPVGTVPIYEAVELIQRRNKTIIKMTKEQIFDVLEQQAQEGVDFFTIHAGVTKKIVKSIKLKKRLLNIVSRGGAILAQWIIANDKENPLYEYFDEVLAIAKKYDITLSLGDGLRPGSIIDASDQPQFAELKELGNLASRALKQGVQVIIEGPGHVPLHQIKKNILLEKKWCHQAPFYVLGPLVTDIACGYDHINAAIGGALASFYGADFLCYVTASEHLRLPTIKDVKEGLIAARIAAHASDIAKGIKSAYDWDRQLSLARRKRDWKKQIELSIDPEKSLSFRLSSQPQESSVCTMCGKYCSLKLSAQI